MKVWPWLLGLGVAGVGIGIAVAAAGSRMSGTSGGWRWRVEPYADGSGRWRIEVLVLYKEQCRVWIKEVEDPAEGAALGRGLRLDLGEEELDFTRPPAECTWELGWDSDPLTGNWYGRKD